MLISLLLSERNLLAYPGLARIATQHAALVRRTQYLFVALVLGGALACLLALGYAYATDSSAIAENAVLALIAAALLGTTLYTLTLERLERAQPLHQAQGDLCRQALLLSSAHPQCHVYMQSVLTTGRPLLQVDLSHLKRLVRQGDITIPHQSLVSLRPASAA